MDVGCQPILVDVFAEDLEQPFFEQEVNDCELSFLVISELCKASEMELLAEEGQMLRDHLALRSNTDWSSLCKAGSTRTCLILDFCFLRITEKELVPSKLRQMC